MAVAVSGSRPASAKLNLLPVPPTQLPFPTSPSLPDRRSRLKRVNLSMTRSRGSLGSEASMEYDKNSETGSLDYGRVKRKNSEDVTMAGQDVIRRRNRTGGRTGQDEVGGVPELELSQLSSTAFVRRSHRNIVTSRHHRQTGAPLSARPPSAQRRRRSRSRRGNQDGRLRLPSISLRRSSSSPQPQGVFLTALNYEESPMATERRPSLSSRTDPKHVPVNVADAAASRVASPPRDHHLPALITSRDNPATARGVVARNTVGLQRVYLEGLDYMRNHVTSVEEEAERIRREFHRVVEKPDEDYHKYLTEVNELLLQANSELRKRNVTLEVVDSDSRLVRLLNELRADKTPDMTLVDALTKFWNELKSTAASLQALLDKFNHTVHQRLSHNYISSNSADLLVPVCQQYALDIEGFLKDLDTQTNNANLVLKSYGSRLHQDLMDSTPFSERLVLTCDAKAFPILGFVHDLCGKITRMCDTARQWLSRDEQFMHEVNAFIRETRSVARKREQILQTEKQKQKRVEKNVRIAQNILHSNKEKLRLIEVELQELEQKLDASKEEQKVRMNEIQHKESMVDFLKVTLQQTKRNYSLQSKRTKLLRQVKELEDYLRLMEADLEVVQDKILAKSHERILLTDKINNSEQSYGVLKSDLDRFSENLEDLEAEVTSLSSQLLQLEIVHTIRTSPETLDNLIDRPSTVKLSKSLKERIRERKKQAALKAS
ncbi:unnamed protein product [Lymnaea stagnalis]|uniref:Uncharacterized protein n=1 Tax=Lymnaea stagnalis TaxID=6523 RepID=A0AAV2H3Q0_LYMST